MSRIAKSARPVVSSFTLSVEADGRLTEVDALRAVVVARQRGVDPGVDRVGLEVEHERRGLRRGARTPRARSPQASAAPRARTVASSAADGARRPRIWPGHRSRAAPSAVRRLGGRAPPRHLLAQRDAVAVADVPVLLQVLRVRDASGAPAHARGGRGAARRRRAAQRQGAAGADRRAARGQRRGAASGWPSSGHEDFIAYVVWACERALERGLLPHTNLGRAVDARTSAGCARSRPRRG